MADDAMIRWVGHRGYPAAYPENSLVGIEGAIAAGAHGVEFDLQLSRDGEPMVFHDADLRRVCGRSGRVDDLDARQLQQFSAHEPARFGQTFYPTPIVPLEALIPVLRRPATLTVFVELKEEMFKHYERAEVLDRVWQRLGPIHDRVVLISFDLAVLRLAQVRCSCPVGWVIRRYTERARRILEAEPVNYVISNYHKLPPSPKPLWSGPWEWFVYDVVTPDVARRCLEQGVRWQETWDVKTMRAVHV